MKYILLADTHLGIFKSSEKYHEVTYNLFKEIFNVCSEKNINNVLMLGDFFHERKATNTKTLNIAHRIADLFEQSNILMYIIIGNHDIYFKDSLVPTTLEIFKEYNQIQVVDKITEIDNIVLCPWGLMPIGSSAEYCMGHFEINGFKMNSNYICDNGQEPNSFQDFKKTFSGHFHTPSSKGNITYLGSAFPQTFHDLGNRHGYYIFDNGELDFIEYTNSPKFVQFKTSEPISHDNATTNLTGNIIKLIFTEDYGTVKNQQIIDEVYAYEPFRVKPDFSMVKIEGTEETQDASTIGLLDHNEIMREYIEKSEFPAHLKKKTIISMIEKLKEE